MTNDFKIEKKYIFSIVLHILLGGAVFALPFLTKVYSILLFLIGLFIIIKNQNKNHEALLFAGYVIGAEVLFRMTSGMHIHEYGKYVSVVFLMIGLYYKGISLFKTSPFFLYILLLVPAIFIGLLSLNDSVVLRKAISFNISGPFCLFIASLYCFDRAIKFSTVLKLLRYIQYPLIVTLAYIILYTPIETNIFRGTDSNFSTSGGFGPNQVSTVLGLGIFICFALMLFAKTNLYKIVQFLLMMVFIYRNFLTFSRGGLYAGILMIIALLVYLYFISNVKAKARIGFIGILFTLLGIATFIYSSEVTGGLLMKRYSGKDALGREKESKFSGREDLFAAELNIFLENPFFGAGLGKSKQDKAEYLGREVATHNEFSRTLAEHGTLGIISFMILMFVPFLHYFSHKQNLFLFSFFLFWLFTINHAAMRLAAPAFVYALSLLKVKLDE